MMSDERIGEMLQGFPERVKELVGEKSYRGFARECGLSETVLRKYLDDRSSPALENLLKMAVAGSVRVEWLATGTEPKQESNDEGQLTQLVPDHSLFDPIDELDDAVSAVLTVADLLKGQGVKETFDCSTVGGLLEVLSDRLIEGIEAWKHERYAPSPGNQAKQ